MKKIIGSLALLCASAAGHAQSTVTVYGLIDMAVSSINNGSGARVTEVTSGVGLASRLGFRGSGDLGSGLKANFTLEQGLSADTGALGQGGVLFGRQMWVGLSSSQGWEFSVGRQYSPVLLTLASTSALGNGYWGNYQGTGIGFYESPGSGAGTGGHQATGRVNNSIVASATRGPFTGRLMLSAGDETTNGTGRLASIGGTYDNGPLLVSAGFARFRQYAPAIVAGADPDWQNEYVVGGAYDFKFVKLFTGYYSYTPSSANRTPAPTTAAGLALDPRFDKTVTYWLGARIPAGIGTFILNLMRTKFEFPTGADGRSITTSIAYEHPLSARTVLYTSYGRVYNDDNSRTTILAAIPIVLPSAAGADPRALSVGVRHSF